MPHPSIANDPAPHPQPLTLMTVLWAVGRPGSGWEDHVSHVTSWNSAFVDQHVLEFSEQMQDAKHAFTAASDVDDAMFFLTRTTILSPPVPAYLADEHRRAA